MQAAMELLYRFITIIGLCFNTLFVDTSGCPGQLQFQSSSSHLSTILAVDANYNHLPPGLVRDNVQDATECARICSQQTSCKSAIYSPLAKIENFISDGEFDVSGNSQRLFEDRNGQHPAEEHPSAQGGTCVLLPSDAGCIRNVSLMSEIGRDQGPILIHCISCLPNFVMEQNFEKDESMELDDIINISVPTGQWNNAENKSTESFDDENWYKTEGGKKKRQAKRRAFAIRVLTFNTFLSGGMVENGLDKVAKHILANDMEIVFLQEMADNHVGSLLQRLGNRVWRACSRNAGHLNHILTRLDIATEYEPAPSMWNNGCQIRLWSPNNDLVINAWNVHLYPMGYGPYKACSKNNPMKSVSDLFETESNKQDPSRGRLQQLEILSRHEPFNRLVQSAAANGPPLIVAGDFNSASHLDWTEEARSMHCQTAFDWPESKFMQQLGFVDSFRGFRTDPMKHAGTTWSTIYKDSTTEFVNGRPEPEPQDRIDFIYYKGQQMQVYDSYVYTGSETISLFPNFKSNDWPSDHASVVTHFTWTIS